jgi:iron complex outermembrane receptor protein
MRGADADPRDGSSRYWGLCMGFVRCNPGHASALWWLLAGGVAHAQPPVAELQPVVVTATRVEQDALLVPAAIDRIDADDLHRAQPGIQLSESLQRIPGVVARDRQNDAQDLQVSIRGFGARATFGVRGVRLYTDGIPATMPDGQGQVSHFSLESAGRIEVLRGPFSALYGNASGGVIALYSMPPPTRPQFSAGAVAGDDGLVRMSGWLRGPWASTEGGYSLDAAHVDSAGYRHHSASRRDSAQALLRGTLSPATRYTLLANSLDLQADDPQGLTVAELGGDRRAASTGALLFGTRKSVRQRQLGLRIEHDLGAAQRMTVTTYAGNRQTAQMLSVPVAAQRNPLSGGGAIDLDRDYGGVDARWRWSSQGLRRPLALTLGIQHDISDEDRRGYENFIGDQPGVRGPLRRDERDRVTGSDQYLQLEWQPGERWRINLGARHSAVRFASRDRYITADNPDDSGSLDYAHTSPVAGVLFRATPWLSLYANAGSGFETPTFNELAYRSDGRSGLNDALRAATSSNIEAGLRVRRGSFAVSTTLFRSRTSDELVVAANQGGRSVYANAGESQRQGLELSLSGVLASHWHVAIAYTLLDARYRRGFLLCASTPCLQPDLLVPAGRRIPGLSRQFAWGEVRWRANDDLDVALEARFVDRVFANDANTAAAPAYARVDLSAERRLRTGNIEWTGFARIDNLFDRDIVGSVIVNDSNVRYFEPAPGRGWTVGLSARMDFD